ncbi:MAG: 30S ribosomal protein S6 [Clostridia bacterium]|nr:30S ribosomal protein S6 [Clostridia bacterium]
MNRYELTIILDTSLEDSDRSAVLDKVTALITAKGGEVEKVDTTWGKRRLAYAINYKTEGWYVLVTFQAPTDLPREIERQLRINENVLRYMTVRVLEKKSKVKPKPVPVRVAPAEAPKAEAVEAAAEAVAAEAEAAVEAAEPAAEAVEAAAEAIEAAVEAPAAE